MCTSQCLADTGWKRAPWGCALLLLLAATVMAAGPDPAGLVLYLPFEDARNPVDASADPTSVVVHGALTSAEGQLGTRGLEFDGNPANRIEVLHAPKLEGMSTLSIEAWAFPRNIASHEGMSIVSKRIANQNADAYNLFIWTGQIVEARVNAGGAVRSTTALQDNNWYHIAYVFDAQAGAGQKTKLYINGVLENTGDHTASAALGSNGGGAPIWVGELDAARGFPWDGVLDEIGIWNIALTEADVKQLMVQTKAKMLKGGIAWNPTPADGADDVLRTTDLAWSPGEYAVTHDVYFGTSRADVNAAEPAILVGQGLARDVTRVDVGALEFGQTYYWRVDEVNGAPDFAVLEGDTWSFTVEPLAYPISNVMATSNGLSEGLATAQRTVDGSGLNAADQHSVEAADMWLARAPADEPLWIQYDLGRLYKLHEMLVWNYNVQFEIILGFGLKDVTVEYSADGEDWTVLGDVQFAKATARADYVANTVVDFGGVPARFVRLNVNSGHGMMGQFGLSEVRFLYIPAQAREPQPADGATNVDPETTLNWRAGRDATSHDVHLGSDAEGLPLVDAVAGSSLVPDELTFGTTYYWRIDAVGDEVWAGEIWSFSTQEYALIDGFETYTDDIDAGEAIFDTWLDGWVNNTGSTVGYLETPFAERTIVRSGRQSMPLLYDNTSSPFYSETSRTFDSPQDWTGNGADTLRLFVAGRAPAFAEA
ncbi:LamG-like jellyroll fold domain-containing protein, partial [Anaerobaca lacustris]|nr:discoidin domain-containing protein [Sedimentisphaerales bacterium M17dextr]